MNKEVRVVDQQRGIVQITLIGERWYARPTTDGVTGLPSYEFVPSVTWITETGYPKGIGFYKWLANTGWDEAQALKEAAGDKGSKVHQAIARLLEGKIVAMTDSLTRTSDGQLEPLMREEYQAILSFVEWCKATQPEVLMCEFTVWNDHEGYAGTVDLICLINGQLWIIDFKTSKSIWPSHRMQVSAYKHCEPGWKDAKIGILQLGYERNKLGYKFTGVEDCYDLFLAAKRIWAEETKGEQPFQKNYPLNVLLNLPKAKKAVASEPQVQEAQASAQDGATAQGGTDGEDRGR